MNSISATDLILIPELSHLRQMDIINPVNDSLISPFLKILGADMDYAIEYIPCMHRNLQGKTVLSYILAWDVECNESFLSSQWATPEDKIIAAGYRDTGLAADLARSGTACRAYGEDEKDSALPPDQINPDEKILLAQIKELERILLLVRGDPYKSDGSRKTFAEQHLVELKPEKGVKRRANRK